MVAKKSPEANLEKKKSLYVGSAEKQQTDC